MKDFNPDEWEIHTIVQKCQVSLHNGQKLIIDVHELYSAGQGKGFIAIPDAAADMAQRELWGRGATKSDAVRACLDKLGEVPADAVTEIE